MKRLIFLFLLLPIFLPQQTARAQAGLELQLISAGPDSVVIRARLFTPSGFGMEMWAVQVTVGYNPAQFFVTAARGVMNHFFAAVGWQSDSNPLLDTNGNNPDLSLYAESHPNFQGLQISQNASIPMCTFTFFPKSSNPGTASFIIFGNVVAPAFTGYWITTSSQNQPFNPAIELSNVFYPVELSTFTASQQGAWVALQWKTESETGNQGFQVERRAMSGQDHSVWRTLDFVEGRGDSREPAEYLFLDRTISQAGTYEYRLKQQDYDGTFSYSSVARVDYVSDVSAFRLESYPTPLSVNHPSTIRFTVPERSSVRIMVTNALGQLVDEVINLTYDAGSYTSSWTPRGIPAGVYFLTMVTDGVKGQQRFTRYLPVIH